MLATAAVPMLMTTGLARRYCGVDTLDGGLTDNCPMFAPTDRPRPVLVVHWDDLTPRLKGRTAGLFFSKEVRGSEGSRTWARALSGLAGG